MIVVLWRAYRPPREVELNASDARFVGMSPRRIEIAAEVPFDELVIARDAVLSQSFANAHAILSQWFTQETIAKLVVLWEECQAGMVYIGESPPEPHFPVTHTFYGKDDPYGDAWNRRTWNRMSATYDATRR